MSLGVKEGRKSRKMSELLYTISVLAPGSKDWGIGGRGVERVGWSEGQVLRLKWCIQRVQK